jgi:hypothetical protein
LFWQGEAGPLRDVADIESRLRSIEDPSAEGAPVLVTGVIQTADDDRVADPPYVWPASFVRLDRVIEGAIEDSEGDEHWESTMRCDEFTSAGFQAHGVRIGDVHAGLEQAVFLGSKPIPIDGEGAHVEPRNGSSAVFEPAFGGFYVAPQYANTPSHKLQRGGVTKEVSCVLSYRGVRSGDRVTLVGTRRGLEIEPWQWRRDLPARIWVVPGDHSSREIASMLVDDALSAEAKKGPWIYAAMAMLGWLVLFVPSFPLFMGFCSCGFVWLMDLESTGKTLAMIAGGAAALLGTLALVNWTQSVAPLVFWLAAVVPIAGWVRSRLGWEDEWGWFDVM